MPRAIGLFGAACFEFVVSAQLALFHQGQAWVLCREAEGDSKCEELQAPVLRVLVGNQTHCVCPVVGKQCIFSLMGEIFLHCYFGCEKFVFSLLFSFKIKKCSTLQNTEIALSPLRIALLSSCGHLLHLYQFFSRCFIAFSSREWHLSSSCSTWVLGK